MFAISLINKYICASKRIGWIIHEMTHDIGKEDFVNNKGLFW